MLDINALWITWENQRRNYGIANALSWNLYCFPYEGKARIERYVKSILGTLIAIVKENPKVIAVQNPSIVLSTLVILLSPIFKYKTIIDAHNAGIFPSEKCFGILAFINKLVIRWAALTLVTNDGLKNVIESKNGRAFILPDRIPDIPEVKSISLRGKNSIVFICTYSDDEPYFEVIEAAATLPRNVIFYFTGNPKSRIDMRKIPGNVKLIGFLPEQEYWNLLYSSDLIMDLTTRNDCLVCGAYEGTALAKPLILSDTTATRSLFNKGCVYVFPTASSISEGITYAIKNKKKLQEEIIQLRSDLILDFGEKVKSLIKIVNRLIK